MRACCMVSMGEGGNELDVISRLQAHQNAVIQNVSRWSDQSVIRTQDAQVHKGTRGASTSGDVATHISLLPLRSEWHRFSAFGEGAVSPATFVTAKLVRCVAPSVDTNRGATSVKLSVGFFGAEGEVAAGQRSTSALFTYYEQGLTPSVSSIRPSYADLASSAPLTLSGSGFAPLGGSLRCRFGSALTRASFVSTSIMRCDAPALDKPGALPAFTSINGGKTWSAAAPLPLLVVNMRAAPTISFVSPHWAPLAGGTGVTVHGANLAPTPGLACTFEQVGTVAATMVNSNAVRCVTPSTSRQATSLRLSLDRSTLSAESLPFIFHDTETGTRIHSIVPNAADTVGAACALKLSRPTTRSSDDTYVAVGCFAAGLLVSNEVSLGAGSSVAVAMGNWLTGMRVPRYGVAMRGVRS